MEELVSTFVVNLKKDGFHNFVIYLHFLFLVITEVNVKVSFCIYSQSCIYIYMKKDLRY